MNAFNVGDIVQTNLSGRISEHAIAARVFTVDSVKYQVVPHIPNTHPAKWFDATYFSYAKGHGPVLFNKGSAVA